MIYKKYNRKTSINFKKNILFLIPILIIGFVIYYLFFSMSNLPKGTLISTLESPNKDYKVNAYLCNGGATVDFSIRVELFNNKTNKAKNIYWKYKEKEVNMQWVDNNIIIINDV